MKRIPDCYLCRECWERPHGRDKAGLVCLGAWCECNECCAWDEEHPEEVLDRNKK